MVNDADADRESPGRIQADIRAILRAANDLDRALMQYGNLIASIGDLEENLALATEVDATEIRVLAGQRGEYADLGTQIQVASNLANILRVQAQLARDVAAAVAESNPRTTGGIAGTSSGVVIDATSGMRGAMLGTGAYAASFLMTQAALLGDMVVLDRRGAQELLRLDSEIERVENGQRLADRARVDELERHLRQEPLLRSEVYQRYADLVVAVAEYRSTREAAQRLLTERNRVRTRTAADFEELRYREMAFSLLRREAADRYRTQFDAAQLDVLMLARQLDFETNYALGGRDRRRLSALTEDLVRTRTLGEVTADGLGPSAGGLAGIVHRLRSEYDNLESFVRGPEVNVTETLDIRQGLFGIPGGVGGPENDATSMRNVAAWRERLRAYVAPSIEDVPALAGCCRDAPAGHVLVLPFETPLLVNGANLYNYFGWRKGRGDDNGFNDSLIGAALTGVQVTFHNYPAFLLNEQALAYLYPAGLDVFRGPGSRDGSDTNVRSWNIATVRGRGVEREPVGDEPGWSPVVNGRAQSSWWARSRDLTPFRIVLSPGSGDAPNTFSTRQHYGRSVYNTQWYLIVPVQWLLPAEPDTAKIVDILLGDSGITNIEVVFGIRAFE